MRKTVFALLVALLLVGSVSFAEATEDSNASVLRLPTEIYLSDEATPIYDAIGGRKLYDAAPQVVPVTGAEDGWDRKLLNGNAKIWFKIGTVSDDKWVHLQNPQFEKGYYQYMVLTGEETFYDARSASAKSAGTITPQTVRYIYSQDEYYRIQTWIGYKWIHPVHPVVDQVHPVTTVISLQTNTPMFDKPDATSKVAGWLAPQQVHARLSSANNEWFYVETWMGPRWINPQIGYPMDMRREDSQLTLSANTPVYEHPDKRARVLGSLAPQTVTVFERGSGWHHIRSDWLGDAWIYAVDPESDPTTYRPPATIVPKTVEAEWKRVHYEPPGNWRGYPFAPHVVVEKDGHVTPKGFGYFPFGEPVGIHFQVANASNEVLTMDATTVFEIEIVRLPDPNNTTNEQTVWSGKLPALTTTFRTPITSEELTFHWDQKDSDGKQVPFGDYMVRIKTPVSIYYTKKGTEGLQRQTANPSIWTDMMLQIGAP